VNRDFRINNDPNSFTKLDLFIQKLQIKGDGEEYAGQRITRSRTDVSPIKDSSTIFELTIMLDNSVEVVSFSRYQFGNALAKVGGVIRFYTLIIIMALAHFTEIDYIATFIKALFLEK
jgi:hypothetical protein